MSDKTIQVKAQLENIKKALIESRQPYEYKGTMVCKNPTLAEWAIEETVCALLDLLESESE